MMNCWLPAEIWVEALQKMGHIDGGLAFDVGQFNAAFARSHEFGSVMSRFDGSNNTGIVRVSYQHRHYEDIVAGTSNIEFHVDFWNRFVGTEAHQGLRQEATKSIRVSMQAKPIMIIGQDESVFAQYLLGSKAWVGPKGQRPLLPKSEGEGYMLSAFVSRELGFGRKMTGDESTKINNERRIGKTYKDIQAATEILKTHQKPLLTESPFVKYLFIGLINEGFWNSFHMTHESSIQRCC
jgi:hypothetical protein